MTASPRTDTPDATLTASELLSFLENPASYPHAPDDVTILQTHISYVALTPPYVYKVKKPVDLGFLDFTTLARRRHYCDQEVTLNRRLCDAIYEGVVPISRTREGLVLEDDTNVVEVAVKMKKLSADGFANAQLERGALTAQDLDRVAAKLHAFYETRSSSPEIAAAGRTEKLRVNTDENFAQTEGHVGPLLSRPAYDTLRYATDRFYDQQGVLLNRRRAGGHIVDAHGDLRLEHVHLTPERVCIYDCIEFNERFRHIDVANDIAFLAMDLDVHGRPDLATHLVYHMVRGLRDPELPRLVNFYKSYRAYVRGKVEGMRSLKDEVPSDERAASQERARTAYQWALRYMVAGSQPLVIAVMGRVATGKSTQAHAIADALGWDAMNSDRVRKQQAGLPLHERSDPSTREALYAREMTEKTYNALIDAAVTRGQAGQGTVLDATFSRRAHRDRLRERLHEADIPYVFVELTADDDTVRTRLRQRATTRRDVVSDARLEDFEMLTQRYEAPDALEDARHIHVASGDDPEATTRDALQHLVRLRPEPAPAPPTLDAD
jgi:hypothetical protein